MLRIVLGTEGKADEQAANYLSGAQVGWDHCEKRERTLYNFCGTLDQYRQALILHDAGPSKNIGQSSYRHTEPCSWARHTRAAVVLRLASP
jgi:hypothetical protein